jgi:hypothetical protein
VPFALPVLRARTRVIIRARVKIWVTVTFIISKDYNIEYRLDYR